MKTYHVYILLCSDDSFYVGMSSALESRMEKHKTGYYKNSFTYSRRPVELVFHTEFYDAAQASVWEKRIKKWSRAKKQALIDGRFDDLVNLAKKKFKD